MLCTFFYSAFIEDKALSKAVWFWLPGNEWSRGKETDGCSSEKDGQMAVSSFREKL